MPKPRGLASIHQLREIRKQRKHERPSAKHWGVVVFGLLLVTAVHVALARRTMAQRKGALLAQQRALAATIGPRWSAVRGVVTEAAVELARDPWPGDRVDASLARRAWRSEPAVFLRVGSTEAATEAAVLDAAKLSPRDAFLACLRAPPLAPGGDRLARFHRVQESFAVTRLLEPAWVEEVQAAEDELRLKVFEEQFAAATQQELGQAAQLVEAAKLVVVVVDEVPRGEDGKAVSVEQAQRMAHGVRVALVDRANKVQLARIRVEPNVTLVPGGESRVDDDEARAALERQANGCSAARLFDAALDAALAPESERR
jgi:hypothetical protein